MVYIVSELNYHTLSVMIMLIMVVGTQRKLLLMPCSAAKFATAARLIFAHVKETARGLSLFFLGILYASS